MNPTPKLAMSALLGMVKSDFMIVKCAAGLQTRIGWEMAGVIIWVDVGLKVHYITALSLVMIAVTATKTGMDLTHLAYAIVTAANPETSTVTLALMYWMSWPL